MPLISQKTNAYSQIRPVALRRMEEFNVYLAAVVRIPEIWDSPIAQAFLEKADVEMQSSDYETCI